ncbi:COP9 signalosome complex subunit 7b isoform X3 [Orcinus orca]|uniref:COP9 signalosome complex subunit 7b isoform X3 n=3 Tax=Delphinidae TaxID=9726 RepID=A0A2U4ADX7_TURTR|nr:COP9 signalosome complex subunit 7b isoform X3 [Tursiops truncatus]XP_030729931.1 COP9 signalosome complex subunit 7b isoform X3 [Globicephala melas]XP_033281268.2 COP9 signalosome complex subunit 7b isoform X3 [Orcinus orca]
MTAHREVTSICMELRNLLQIMAQLKPHFLQKASLNHLSPGHSQESLICTPGAPCGIICPSQMDLSLPGTLSSPRSQDQRMAGEQKPSSNLLEQFILLAKGTSGSALTALISQVLEAPGVYVFGELLELANVQELAEGGNAAYLQLLNLFAYGTYPDYIANKESLPELSTAQQNKLKHLTIVSLASRMKCIPYSVLLKDLEMRNLRELEDLIIEAVYTDIIQGKLDQRNQLLEVDFCIGRDIRKKDINNIVKTLHEWCDGCEAVLLGIEQQVLRANQYKENHSRTQQQVEAEMHDLATM